MTSDIDALRARADALGVTYRSNTKADTLAARIAEAEASAGADDVEPPTAAPAPASPDVVLDTSRPYATVHGAGGTSYFQDGLYFNLAGQRVKG